ncbi:hypothetical protein EF834_01740 [Rhodococcus spongiicola]|uniref:Uncharacterized protein n=1 Tax=Rhodococcus spongiicola TaxID=2487352 RepID=A0A3S3AJK9_9NOCA|nr:hypothetical protein EF834_01740 [Rhodococcus spongiicola]
MEREPATADDTCFWPDTVVVPGQEGPLGIAEAGGSGAARGGAARGGAARVGAAGLGTAEAAKTAGLGTAEAAEAAGVGALVVDRHRGGDRGRICRVAAASYIARAPFLVRGRDGGAPPTDLVVAVGQVRCGARLATQRQDEGSDQHLGLVIDVVAGPRQPFAADQAWVVVSDGDPHVVALDVGGEVDVLGSRVRWCGERDGQERSGQGCGDGGTY